MVEPAFWTQAARSVTRLVTCDSAIVIFGWLLLVNMPVILVNTGDEEDVPSTIAPRDETINLPFPRIAPLFVPPPEIGRIPLTSAVSEQRDELNTPELFVCNNPVEKAGNFTVAKLLPILNVPAYEPVQILVAPILPI
jgi:hypothetical protein